MSEYFKPVELESELKDYLENYGVIGTILRHPLVFGIPYHDAMNEYYNRSLEAKKGALAKAVRAKKWEDGIWLHERPYRLQAFVDFCPRMTEAQYWRLLSRVWVDAESPSRVNRKIWLQLFEGFGGLRWNRARWIMDAGERAVYKDLPAKVTVWRGAKIKESKPGRKNKGISWTLDRDKARFFARRFSGTGIILQATATKEDIYAYFNGRNEKEIVIDPAKLKNINVIETIEGQS